MSKDKIPVTPALLMLKKNQVDFIPRSYSMKNTAEPACRHGNWGFPNIGSSRPSSMEDEHKLPLIILMHGDQEVSTKALARILGVKSIHPCDPKTAEKRTGYRVGGTSPFGTKKTLPIYMEETIAGLPCILINAGSRGLLAEMPHPN